jgi:hypothetical protein
MTKNMKTKSIALPGFLGTQRLKASLLLLYLIAAGVPTLPKISAQTELQHKMGIFLNTDIYPDYFNFNDFELYTYFSVGASYQVEKNRFWCNMGLGYEQQYLKETSLYVVNAVTLPIQFGGNFYTKNKLTISAWGGLKLYYQFLETVSPPSGKTYIYWRSPNTYQGICWLTGGVRFLYAFSPRFSLGITPQMSTMFFGFSARFPNEACVMIPFIANMIGVRIDMLFNLKSKNKSNIN